MYIKCDIFIYFLSLQRDDLNNHFHKLGYYREVPTPELLREAQGVFRKLDWDRPIDDDGNVVPSPPMTSKDDVKDEEAFSVLDEHAVKVCANVYSLVIYLRNAYMYHWGGLCILRKQATNPYKQIKYIT